MKLRKPLRLPGYDYSTPGYYFVTTCTQNMWEYFGKIENDKMILNDLGRIVAEQWLWLKQQYSYIELDEWVVMPNHFHGIIAIDCDPDTACIKPENNPANVPNVREGHDPFLRLGRLRLPGIIHDVRPLTEMIGAFKSTSSKIIHQKYNPEFQWQRSFHDHIIRDEESLNRIRQYVLDNPANWKRDKNNLVNDFA
jgi:REP element-mobilizing transposase RayT